MSGLPTKSDYILEEYRVETPETVRGIVSLVESTLTMGGVQEITIRQGEPILIKRFVRGGSQLRGVPPTSRAYSQELKDVAKIEELSVGKAAPFDMIARMLTEVEAHGLEPCGIFCKNRAWLYRELFPDSSPEDTLLGLEVFEVTDLPSDVVLVGGSPATGLPLTHVVKVVLDMAEVEETPIFGRPEWREN